MALLSSDRSQNIFINLKTEQDCFQSKRGKYYFLKTNKQTNKSIALFPLGYQIVHSLYMCVSAYAGCLAAPAPCTISNLTTVMPSGPNVTIPAIYVSWEVGVCLGKSEGPCVFSF